MDLSQICGSPNSMVLGVPAKTQSVTHPVPNDPANACVPATGEGESAQQ